MVETHPSQYLRLEKLALGRLVEMVCRNASGYAILVSADRLQRGHLKPDLSIRAAGALDAHDKTAAEEVASFEHRHLKEIGDLVKREDIDCDYVLTRSTDVCLYSKGRDELKAKLDKVTAAGISTADDVFYSAEKTAEAVSFTLWNNNGHTEV